MNDQSGEKRVKVIDRRWFTPEGEARPDSELPPPEPSRSSEPPPLAPSEEPSPATLGPPPAALPSQALLDTVDFLAQYAMAFLTGQVPGVPRSSEAARLYIDLLNHVRERTRTTASLQEAKVLDDVLHQLRLQLVAAAR